MYRFVVVTGMPASGKTTLAVEVARVLGWHLFDKDEFLERLFEEQGVGDLHWRRQLSKRADLLLQESALKVTRAVLSSWWRHPESSLDSGTSVGWLDNDLTETLELRCVCSSSIAASRFVARQRHPGHLDGRWSYQQLVESFTEQAALGPLLHGKVIELNTEVVVPPHTIQALAAQALQWAAGARTS